MRAIWKHGSLGHKVRQVRNVIQQYHIPALYQRSRIIGARNLIYIALDAKHGDAFALELLDQAGAANLVFNLERAQRAHAINSLVLIPKRARHRF